ncbi:sigma-54 interaction domain-containing protein [Peribacillus acanthi]|uniref:sigma-54 interaction domain-containing protein n=1 Tax=Peribacillus acanthi TaxID=2171554 RepID=UPI000D3E1D97|nr:sigma 54-interacting transcriptional regulator [Peribacillus acanthi]
MNHNVKNYPHIFIEKILDEIDVGIHAIDEKGKTIIYNRKMSEIEGMLVEDVLDKNVLEVFPFQHASESTLLQTLLYNNVNKNIKQTYFNNKGQEITTINDTFPIKKNNKIIGAIEIAKDITKLERLIKENSSKKTGTRYTFDQIIFGDNSVMKDVIETSKRATRTSSSVLIVGETGTGKELFAQSIHNGSNRSSKPFISQNCAALPDSLIESLLFGTKKGAFTGAIERPGLFEQAEGGTILLDELNALDISLQAKLLRALQENTIRRVGDTKDIPIDVRIIATINEDPVDAIANGRLRKDLFYRLSVVSIFIPPLRERKEDIPLLIKQFIDKYNTRFGLNIDGVEEEVLERFQLYDWPGNVRELQHVIEGAMNLVDYEEWISTIHLPIQTRMKTQFNFQTEPPHIEEPISINNRPCKKLEEQMMEVEKKYITKTLSDYNHNISHTAKALGISRQSLQYRIRKYQISTKG